MATTKYDISPTAELEDIAGYFADAFRNRSAGDRVNREGDKAEVHEIALVLNARYDAAAEAKTLDARLAMIKSWMPITIGGDTGQTGTIVIERDVETRKIVKAKTWLWQPGAAAGPSFGRWADLMTEHWFLPARDDQRAHARTVPTLQLGEWLDDGTYLKGSTLHTAALEELYERATFEAAAREESDDEWTRGALAAAAEWNRPWPGEQAPASA
jgi:hypothetical protein